MQEKALITNISKLSSHDGPGTRMTIFFKGCPLRCLWCHNPETLSSKQSIAWNSALCIKCNSCMQACPIGALDLKSVGQNYLNPYSFKDVDICENCGLCVEACPSNAMYYVSKYYFVEEVASMIKKELPLLNSLGGGITFSGGEPTLNTPFILSVLKELKNEKIHVALDTCGVADFEKYEVLLPYIDLVLYDLKEIDSIKHKFFTGTDNLLVKLNFEKIINLICKKGLKTKIWIRTPLIPKYTATADNIIGLAKYIDSILLKIKDVYGKQENLIERWELCAFNNMCADKYHKLGKNWIFDNTELLKKEDLETLSDCAKKTIKNNLLIRATGLTKREKYL